MQERTYDTYDRGNWGKWGKDDERGALNYITSEVIFNALKMVKKGKTYSLGMPIRHGSKGIPNHPRRIPPFHLAGMYPMTETVNMSDDYISMNTHSQTHLDALAHRYADGKIYNGYSSDENIGSTGAKKCGIDKVGSIVTRGILLDVASYEGVDSLENDVIIDADTLRKCARDQGTEFHEGDAVLVRTGCLNRFDPENPDEFFKANPGLDLNTSDIFIEEHSVLVGSDNYAVDVIPTNTGNRSPLHNELLWKRGVYLIELINLEEIARDKVYEFLFVVNPLNIEWGLGSPINPVAVC